jgi:hypothetical protein
MADDKVRKYIPAWENDFPWVAQDEAHGPPMCTWCSYVNHAKSTFQPRKCALMEHAAIHTPAFLKRLRKARADEELDSP